MGLDAIILLFWMLSFKPTFSLSSFTFIKNFFSSFSLSAISLVLSAYLWLLIFLPTILILAHQQYVNFQMFKLDLEKAVEPEIKLPTSVGSSKKQESSRKTSTSASLTMPKPLTVWITIHYGKFLELGIPDHLTCLQRNLYAPQEATVRTRHGTTD